MVETSLQVEPTEETTITPSEERRRTGQYVVVGVIIVTSLIGLYHACVHQNAMLAGVIVPALIMMLYLIWVLHSARKSNKKYASSAVPTVVGKQTSPETLPSLHA